MAVQSLFAASGLEVQRKLEDYWVQKKVYEASNP
jgi:hypothetical protein